MNKLLLFIFILLIALFIMLTGCKTKAETPGLSKEDLTANSLTGSCPSGNSCNSPSCGSWSNINKDGLCDRSKGII